jgi:uncharacterized protein YjbJ (UPF0337 family)
METTVREVVGNVQDSLVDVAGDIGMQLSGKVKALRGNAQQLCADTAALARDSIFKKPLATLAVVATAGFVLGILWPSNRTGRADGGMRRR